MAAQDKKAPTLHPFLIAAYPVVSLLATNIEEVKAVVAARALGLSLIISVALYLILKTTLKNSEKAGVITTLLLAGFFSYGHIYSFLEQSAGLGASLGRHRILAPLWLVILAGGIISTVHTKRNFTNLTKYLNLIAGIALILPLFNIARVEARAFSSESAVMARPTGAGDFHHAEGKPAPDVYYIILDAYARDDTLLEDHGFDNAYFLHGLEELGFYVARCSQSNYAQTQLSLASSLNMEYIQDLGAQFTPGNNSRAGVDELIRHSRVRQIFESLGYSTVAFETGFKYTQWEDADLYLSPSATALEKMQITGGLNEFESILLKTTAGLLFEDGSAVLPKFLQMDTSNPRRIHRDRILFVLDQLSSLPDSTKSRLVFAHMVIPHPPYVFGAGGEFTNYDLEAKVGYIDQIQYLNSVLLPLLQTIIDTSPTPPVIVIQGDHGAIHSPPDKRLNILNAIYLPTDYPARVYPQISPVNTFRLILDTLFDGKLPLLPDTSYFSSYKTPYDFTTISNTRPGCDASLQPES